MHERTADVQFGDPRLPARFWARVEIADSGCWHWTGSVGPSGHAQVKINGRKWPVHRYAFCQLVQDLPIPRGKPGHLEVDHNCHNLDDDCAGGPTCMHRRCVNVAHLRAVTQRVNLLAGKSQSARNARKTSCERGHKFDEANTMYSPDGHRTCRTCAKRTNEQYRERKLGRPLPGHRGDWTHCLHGHELAGDNLVLRDGRRRCKACIARRKREYLERKLGRPRQISPKDRTHCQQGHPLSGDNLYLPPGGVGRQCRTCRRDRGREAKRARSARSA